ncbi:rhomboid family intramembrane serine protease [uncultured Paraglaciecola sp.]|jgi:membrane associated rhomboid family serine protease|uniref:rhomboid family intramembrane serine protease n=1 Tax=uncultured Paraglaciecola sp. TaxID=1765024 RepID=UPI0025FAF475|nr:rhomboid family intramembrane serine protease [uncultured Paraglaciecola sp.]
MNSIIKPLNHNQHIRLVLAIFVLFSVIEVINLFTGRMLSQLGTIPRYVPGLKGIILGPFVHGSLQHYFSNIIPLCIFSYLLLQYGLKRYLQVTLWIMLTTGLLVWLFARPATHIGVSGVIYGYFGYLVLAGFLSGKFKLIIISVLVAFFYGGLIWGVLPSSPFVSWESHLFGFIAGLAAAKLWAKPSL